MDATHKAAGQQRQAISANARSADAHAFFNLLTGPELFDAVELALPPHRERLFPPTETLSMFLAQALSADRSCQRAVNEGAIKRLIAGLKPKGSESFGFLVVLIHSDLLVFLCAALCKSWLIFETGYCASFVLTFGD